MTEAPTSTPPPAPARSFAATAGGAVVLVALWAVLQLWGLGGIPFHTKGDPREGLVVWEMTHHGGWILPKRNGTEVPSKPPLFHWMGAVAATLRGVTDEWSIRFPSAALSLGGSVAIYAAGTALWGPTAGLLSATITLTSFEWQRAATSARVDMALTFGLSVALLAYLFVVRSGGRALWVVLFYAGVAFATLAKGPVGVAIPGLVIAASCAVTRDLSPLWRLRLVRGGVAVALAAGWWYVAAVIVGGSGFFTKQILNENLFRFFSSAEFEGGHRHGPLYLVGGFAAGFLPWTLFLPAMVATLWRERTGLRAGDPRVYLLLWIAAVFVFYAVAVSKRSVYLLSLYPAAGLLTGVWWAEHFAGAERSAAADVSWLRVALSPVVGVLGVAVALLALATALEACGVAVVPWAAGLVSEDGRMYAGWIAAALRARAGSSLLLLAATTVALAGAVRALRGGSWRVVFVLVVTMLVAAGTFTQHVVLPSVASKKTYRDFMTAVRAATAGESPAFYRTIEYGAVYYWGGHIQEFRGELASAPRYLLMTRDDWDRLPPVDQASWERVLLPSEVEEGDGQRLVLVRRRPGALG